MSLQRQTLINTIGNVTYLASQWLLTVITTRILGYEAVGVLTLAMSVGSVFTFIQLYGVRGFQSSDTSIQYTPGDYLNTRFVTTGLGLFICIVFTVFSGYTKTICFTIILFTVFRTSEAISDVFFGDFQREGRLELVGYTMFFRGILTVGLFISGLSAFGKLNIALLITALGALSLTILLDRYFYKIVVPWKKGSTGGLKGVLGECFPLFLAALLPTVITAFPRVILEQYYGTELLGYYGNVSTPAVIITAVVPNLLASIMPVYGKLVTQKQNRKIRKLWMKTLLWTIAILFLSIISVAVVGKPVLAWIYTESIVPYIPYLYYLLFATTLYAFTMCGAAVLTALRKNIQVCICAMISTVTCIVISFPLVHAYGITGAVTVLVVSYSVQVIVQSIVVIKYTKTL